MLEVLLNATGIDKIKCNSKVVTVKIKIDANLYTGLKNVFKIYSP